MNVLQSRAFQSLQHQHDDFRLTLARRRSVKLRAGLQQLPSAAPPGWPCVQYRTEIAQPGGTPLFEIVDIDPDYLRSGIGAHAQGPAAELIREFEGLQLEILASAGEQRFQVLKQWRDHQLIAETRIKIEDPAADSIEFSRHWREYF